MIIKPPAGITSLQLAERIVAKAYDAAKVVGMGAFQERLVRPTDKLIFDQANYLDRGGDREYNYDYVFGRMMKLYFAITAAGELELPDHGAPREDYQSWATTYPTYAALAEAAVKSFD